MESNIPRNIFYSAIKEGKFLGIACSILCFRNFIPMVQELLEHMKKQIFKRVTTGTSLRKMILAHPESFQHLSISCQDLLNIFSKDELEVFS